MRTISKIRYVEKTEDGTATDSYSYAMRWQEPNGDTTIDYEVEIPNYDVEVRDGAAEILLVCNQNYMIANNHGSVTIEEFETFDDLEWIDEEKVIVVERVQEINEDPTDVEDVDPIEEPPYEGNDGADEQPAGHYIS
jgi:hypothetical protein